ncbi:uncharacterized protein C8A04DRAFT_26804 [Dichotomopilus funicola]|uniref:Uncharacterized protein n=1 Tax=Dichotomopilus funicola TaxID=1934379 RepID=A0AAN6ZPJ6_9PEZI|nr:hypothetical protein C8A04DRAFT_26804 [Dichotomopilus funicola]
MASQRPESPELGTLERPFVKWCDWCDAMRRYKENGGMTRYPRHSIPRIRKFLVTKIAQDIESQHPQHQPAQQQDDDGNGNDSGGDAGDLVDASLPCIYVPWREEAGLDELVSVAGALEVKTFDIHHGDETAARDRLDVYGVREEFMAAISGGRAGGAGEDDGTALDRMARRVAEDTRLMRTGEWLDLPPSERRYPPEIRADKARLARTDMITRAVAHQRAKMAAARAAGRKEFQWGDSYRSNMKFYRQMVIVLGQVPKDEDEQAWETVVFYFVWFDLRPNGGLEDDDEILEVTVDPIIGSYAILSTGIVVSLGPLMINSFGVEGKIKLKDMKKVT